MGISIFKQFNFLDILILILLFRICYIAVKTGLVIELFKLLGVIFAIYVASHYYAPISDVIRKRYLHQAVPLEFIDFLVFVLLALLVYLCFVLLRITFYRFMKMEATPKLSKYGGFVLGIVRGYFSIGLMIYLLMISSVSYLSSSVRHSYLGSKFSSVSAHTYNWMWNSVFSKISPQEKPNSVVNEVRDNFTKK
jgi:uncharacterized membrane protein required for colicin V production